MYVGMFSPSLRQLRANRESLLITLYITEAVYRFWIFMKPIVMSADQETWRARCKIFAHHTLLLPVSFHVS